MEVEGIKTGHRNTLSLDLGRETTIVTLPSLRQVKNERLLLLLPMRHTRYDTCIY